MPVLLLNLRDVPEDEADDVRALLDERRIEFYETRPSLWGVSAGGIWLVQDEDADIARRHLADYQAARAERVRGERALAEAEGSAPGAWAAFREHPLRALATVLGIVLMLAVATLPFLLFGR